jgi:hypothetical protein
MVEGETEVLVKKELNFSCFAFFGMSLYTSFCGAMYYSVLLCKGDYERARDLGSNALPQNFSTMHKPVNEVGVL